MSDKSFHEFSGIGRSVYESLEGVRNAIRSNELAITSSLSSLGALDRSLMWKEQVSAITESLSSFRAAEALAASTDFNAPAFQNAADILRQTAVPSASAFTGSSLLTQSDSVRQMLDSAVPSMVLASSLSESFAKISGSDLRLLALPEYTALKVTALRSAELQALVGGMSAGTRLAESLEPLSASLSSFTTLSAAVWDKFGEMPRLLTTAPGWLIEAPVVQAYEASRNVAQIAGAEEDVDFEFDEPASVHGHERATVTDRLAVVGPEYAAIFREAKEALAAKNRGYIRHASVSLRELLDKLLDRLVSAETIHSWPEGAELLKKGQTHKVRLLYLFRDLSGGPYAAFVEKDIDLILQTFVALNGATHKLESPFGDDAMRVLTARIEGHLLMLLAAAEEFS